jgi:hypothetical protein
LLYRGKIVAQHQIDGLLDTEPATLSFSLNKRRTVTLAVDPTEYTPTYTLSIDGQNIVDYNRKMWKQFTRWYFAIDEVRLFRRVVAS